MQTFLPFADFAASAQVLDPRRLGKQRVEALQVVRAITIPTYGWRHHPAAVMWRGYEEALGAYGLAICHEWTGRGHADTCAGTIRADLASVGVVDVRSQEELARVELLPPWLGDERVHRTHRSALLRKEPAWYVPRFHGVPDDLPYYWPGEASPKTA